MVIPITSSIKTALVFNVSPDLPAIVNVRMTDNFRLKGHGLHMHVSFDVTLETIQLRMVSTFTLERPCCSDFPVVPFVFATADG